jgi:N-acetylglucosaminyldiphosphoundecaprenol N-acetyl-beta-D-mannosaminyltransferase
LRKTLVEWIFTERPRFIITAGSLLLLEAQKSKEVRAACEAASLMIPESAGVIWAAHQLKLGSMHRRPGIDLALELCEIAELNGAPVYLLGGAPGVAERAADFLVKCVLKTR